MDLNGNIKIGLKGIETASFWRIRSYDRNCEETLVCKKMEEDRIASFRDHRAEP